MGYNWEMKDANSIYKGVRGKPREDRGGKTYRYCKQTESILDRSIGNLTIKACWSQFLLPETSFLPFNRKSQGLAKKNQKQTNKEKTKQSKEEQSKHQGWTQMWQRFWNDQVRHCTLVNTLRTQGMWTACKSRWVMRAERWKLTNQKERIDMRNTSLEVKNAFDGLMTAKNMAKKHRGLWVWFSCLYLLQINKTYLATITRITKGTDQLVRTSSRYANVGDSIPSQGTNKN